MTGMGCVFAVGGQLRKFLWTYVALVGSTLCPERYFWHNWREGEGAGNTPLVGHQSAGGSPTFMALFLLTWSSNQNVSCSA